MKQFLWLFVALVLLACGARDPYRDMKVPEPDPFFNEFKEAVVLQEGEPATPVESEAASVDEEVDSPKNSMKDVCFINEVQYERIKKKRWDECGDVIVDGYDSSGQDLDRLSLQDLAVRVANSECWAMCPGGTVTNLRIAYLTLNGDTWTLKIRYYAQEQISTAKDNPEDREAVFRELFRGIIRSVMNNSK